MLRSAQVCEKAREKDFLEILMGINMGKNYNPLVPHYNISSFWAFHTFIHNFASNQYKLVINDSLNREFSWLQNEYKIVYIFFFAFQATCDSM